MVTEQEVRELTFHPMDQFIVKPLFGGDAINFYTPTNVTFWMGLAVLCILALLVLGTRGRAIVPSRIQSVAELLYGFIYKMVEDVAGKDAVRYFPYIMTLFVFIVFSNFLGLLPLAFTTTSHIAVTAVMAMMVFLTVTILGFVKHGFGFLRLFWLDSAPLVLRPILLVIEVISYFVRPGQPFDPACRQHDGRSRGDQGFRGFRADGFVARADRLYCHPGLNTGDLGDLCARGAGGLHPGLCLCNSHMRLSEGRVAPGPLSPGAPATNLSDQFQHPKENPTWN